MNVSKLKVLLFLIFSSLLTLSFTVLAEAASGQHQTLQTDAGKTFNAYVAGDENSQQGLLLIHGWLGLDKGVQNWAEQMGKAGYYTMAIDLYDGQTADNPEDAKKLMMAVNQQEANNKYLAAITALDTPERKIAVFGKSYGASQALQATLTAPEKVDATVSYYPFQDMPTDKKTLMALQSPVLIEVGDKDFAFTVEKAKAFKAGMENAGRALVMNVYQAGHGFDQPMSPNFDASVRDTAMKSTQAFLAEHLQ